MARQDQPAQEAAFCIHRLHRHRRAHHHHHHRAGCPLGQHAVACTDHGHPAVGSQAGRMVITVRQARLLRAGDHPLRRDVPQLHLLLHTAANGLPRHHTAQHAGGGGQAGPVGLGKAVNVFKKLRTMCQHMGIRTRSAVQRPFQPGIADINCQECHGADYGCCVTVCSCCGPCVQTAPIQHARCTAAILLSTLSLPMALARW